MDPQIIGGVIGAIGIITVAWIGRPSRKSLRRIESEFSTNGGSSQRDLLERIERKQDAAATSIAHLTGRFDQHLNDIRDARTEGIQMWTAVEAVAKADPPQQETA